MPLKLSSMRCGECFTKGMELKDVAGWFQVPWKNYPKVTITKSYEMPVCPSCNNVIEGGGWGENLDKKIEESIREVTTDLIKTILRDNNLTSREFSKIVGITPEYLSSLVHEKTTPTYTLFQLLSLLCKEKGLISVIRENEFL